MKYRILEQTIDNKEKYYIIQQKFLFWWFNTRFKYIGYFTSSSSQFVDTISVTWKTLKQAKFIVNNYKEYKYKRYTIYPCLMINSYNEYKLNFYIDMKYGDDKLTGSLEHLKNIINKWTYKDAIIKKVVWKK